MPQMSYIIGHGRTTAIYCMAKPHLNSRTITFDKRPVKIDYTSELQLAGHHIINGSKGQSVCGDITSLIMVNKMYV